MHDVPKNIRFTKKQADKITDYLVKQKPVPSFSEAVRQLAEIGLDTINSQNGEDK